jgi:hypothetical protein
MDLKWKTFYFWEERKKMEISIIYQIDIENVQHFVYEGTCDGIPTKWVTKSKWDGNIKVQMVNNKLHYTDNDGKEILVFDETDVEYKYIQP